ncbi:MAG: MerR family transcriptional regulator [Microbacteriaceae bacterium]|nr:MerR family transcriptional regulator [Microbacteriaceae bacterium]MCL2795536.1 MerR family transcriptional regulator [Microbacteriaceae bacterium]
MSGLRVGEVAARAGVNVETLRYYERRGLLAEPLRTLGGHRSYDEHAVTVIRVVKAAQALGFTLDEVADMLARRAGAATDTLAERAQAKLADVHARIAELRDMAESLQAAIDERCVDLISCAQTNPWARADASSPAPDDEENR